ncbi:MAG: hypothetical protein AAF714_01890 [Pseudomonadota bacterium]
MIKHIAAAVTAIALTSGVALASNDFGILEGVEEGATFYDVPLIRAEMGGMLQIETATGEVIGMAELQPGPNTDVRVDFDTPLANVDLVLKLIVDGAVKETEMVRVMEN